MKKMLFFAATAMLFAACSSEEIATPEASNQAPQAVAFDTYVPTTTRSGAADVMTTTTLQTTGFGVFANQSDNGVWDGTGTPNFMYNQQVTYTTPSWVYTPLKYWPNETTKDSQTTNGAATSTGADRLSFFAYAPYVGAITSTGVLTSAAQADQDNASPANAVTNVGITALSKNTDAGAPKVSYQIAYTPAYSVDLLWGVAPTGGLSYQTVNPDWTTTSAGAIGEYMPLLDLVKPAKDQKIKFLFRHALARLGMKIVAAVDQMSAGGTLGSATKIYVNSITITDASDPTKTIPVSGDLQLQNASAGVANWVNTTVPSGGIKLVVSDGRSNINPALVGSGSAQTQPGVTTSETTVIKDGKYFMLIPTPGHAASLNVTIDYTVYTNDTNVDGGYTTTNNVITKQVVLNSTEVGHTGFTNNKAYELKLILGLTSVKLDAEVADWEVDGSSEVNLPRNND